MSDDFEFIKGLSVFKPHPKAPDFVICDMKITMKELGNWLRGREEDEIRVQVKCSKAGKYYAAINTYEPDTSGSSGGRLPPDEPSDDFDDDIPF